MHVNLCMLFFLSLQYCCFQSSEFNNTPVYQYGRGGRENKAKSQGHKNINIPVFQICGKKNDIIIIVCLWNQSLIFFVFLS